MTRLVIMTIHADMTALPTLAARYLLITLACLFAGCTSTAPTHSETQAGNQQTQAGENNKTFKRSTPLKYANGERIATLAHSLIGSPYRYGGASPQGFDCSGLVYYTHQQLDITVPRTSTQQAQYRTAKPLSSAQPGDILFFRIYGNQVSHVGIYVGNEQFIHAPKSGKSVSYASLNEPYWRSRLIKVATLY